MMDVGKVETDRRVSDARLAGPRIADLNFLIAKLFGAAIPVNADGVDAAHAIVLDDLLEWGRATVGASALSTNTKPIVA
jgi:hypothetical protein